MATATKYPASMADDLASAVRGKELTLVYQCIVDLPTLQVVGCEALLRWVHADYGSISPSVFVPIAERTGLIVPLGNWVLREASRAAAHWPSHITVAVNLSPRQLSDPAAAADISAIVTDAGLALDRLELEITESHAIDDYPAANSALRMLRERGVRIALDDFGIGYSSMAQLRDMPVDRLKVDRSFVSALTGANAGKSFCIVSALIRLCEMMHLGLTAEGVENELELDCLRELGCRNVQGFYFAEPMDEPALLAFLHEREGAVRGGSKFSPKPRLEYCE